MTTSSTYYVLGAQSTITRQVESLPLRNQKVNKELLHIVINAFKESNFYLQYKINWFEIFRILLDVYKRSSFI